MSLLFRQQTAHSHARGSAHSLAAAVPAVGMPFASLLVEGD